MTVEQTKNSLINHLNGNVVNSGFRQIDSDCSSLHLLVGYFTITFCFTVNK